MKKFLFTITTACLALSASAQSITSYYMPDAIERRNLNVAFAPERGYVSIPFVGSVDMSINGNMSISTLLHDTDDGLVSLLDSSVSSADALGNLKKGANFTGFNTRLDLVSFGAYSKKDKSSFWSVDLAMRTNANFSMPYEFFEFVKAGKASNISDIDLYMESFMDFSFGRSRYINDKLLVGVRVKMLVGIASANLNISKFNIKLDNDEWAVDAAGNMEIYGPGITNTGNVGDEFDFDDIEMNGFSPAGLGAAIDLGAEYQVLDNLKVSLAANDIGFMSWREKSGVSATVAANQSFTGVEIDGGGTVTEESVEFSFDEMDFNYAKSESSTRFLQANLIAGAEYSFLNELIGVSGLYTMHFWRSKTMHDVVLAANVRPISWFTAAMSYSLVNNSGNAVGLALNFSPSWFNLFLASDILLSKKSAQFIPIDQSVMNVSLGLAVPLGKRSLRSKYTKLTKEE